jgi:hypothetical protein
MGKPSTTGITSRQVFHRPLGSLLRRGDLRRPLEPIRAVVEDQVAVDTPSTDRAFCCRTRPTHVEHIGKIDPHLQLDRHGRRSAGAVLDNDVLVESGALIAMPSHYESRFGVLVLFDRSAPEEEDGLVGVDRRGVYDFRVDAVDQKMEP